MRSFMLFLLLFGAVFLVLGALSLVGVMLAHGRRKGPGPGKIRRVTRWVVPITFLGFGLWFLWGANPRFVFVATDPEPPPSTLREMVHPLVAPDLDAGRHVGLVVGVTTDGRREVASFGRLLPSAQTGPPADGVFPIGSVTKVFTGVLLAEMAARGELSLDDSVALHLPEAGAIPDGDSVTLAHLATHTSGLPRLPRWMATMPGKLASWRFVRDPYRGRTRQELLARLGDLEIESPPGASYQYSNLGLGLLGHALERAGGADYGSLVRARLSHPLGLEDTREELAGNRSDRLVPGHYGWARLGRLGIVFPARRWDLPILQGAGSLASTVPDLLDFLEATLDPPAGPLGEALRTALEPHHRDPDGKPRVGLGWMLRARDGVRPVAWHNGATGGYTSFAAVLPHRQVGIVVLANSLEPVDPVGWALVERFEAQ